MTIFWGRGLTSIYTLFLRMLKDECNPQKFKFEHSAPDDFTVCMWQKKPNVLPLWIGYRTTIFIYVFITLLIIILDPEGDTIWYKNLIYVGYWGYFVETLAFGLAFYVTVEKFVKQKKDPELPPLETMPWHYKTLWFFYTVAASTSLAVTTMFWFFTYDPNYNTLLYSLLTRGFNTVAMLIEISLNAIPVRFLHFYIPGVFVLFYVAFTIIYQFSGGTGNRGLIPIYPILDWRNPKTAVSTVVIYIACAILFHCGMCVINIMKNWLKKPSSEEVENN